MAGKRRGLGHQGRADPLTIINYSSRPRQRANPPDRYRRRALDEFPRGCCPHWLGMVSHRGVYHHAEAKGTIDILTEVFKVLMVGDATWQSSAGTLRGEPDYGAPKDMAGVPADAPRPVSTLCSRNAAARRLSSRPQSAGKKKASQTERYRQSCVRGSPRLRLIARSMTSAHRVHQYRQAL
jgi:hypothetical protein